MKIASPKVAELIALRDAGVTQVEFHPDGTISRVSFSVMPSAKKPLTTEEREEEDKKNLRRGPDAMELAEEIIAQRR